MDHKKRLQWFFRNRQKNIEGVSTQAREVKTMGEFIDFVDRAKGTNSPEASRAIGYHFGNPYYLGTHNRSPVYQLAGEFDAKKHDTMVTYAIDALEGMPGGAKEIGEIVDRETGYYTTLENMAKHADVDLQKHKTHEDYAIAALLRIGSGEALEVMAEHIGLYYPEKVISALEGVQSNDAVFAIGKIVLGNDRSSGISPNKILVLDSLLSTYKKVEAGELESIADHFVTDEIMQVCERMLDGKHLLESLMVGGKPMPDDELARLRDMFETADEILGYDASVYAEIFDLTVGFRNYKMDGECEIRNMQWELDDRLEELRSLWVDTNKEIAEKRKSMYSGPEVAF